MLLLLSLSAWAFPEDQAATPPMGWNSWNCYGTTVSAEGVLAQAQAIVDSGLRDKGYVYVVIDDGWQGERSGDLGALQGNSAFPDIGALAAEVRAMGLRLGIYSTPWDTSYGGFPGGQGHEAADAWQWARWGVRYLKYDWNPVDPANTRRMHDALASTGAPIVFSLSNTVPQHLAPTWANLANLWRTTTDITDTWESLQKIGFSQAGWEDVTGPGHWNDPDMMILGYVGWGAEQHLTRLTADEQRTHVTLWALLAAPLLLGADLTRLDADTIALVTNDRVLEVDQDPAGLQATRTFQGDGFEVWSRSLANGSRAVGVFNRGETELSTTIEWGWTGTTGPQPTRDLWTDTDVPTEGTGVPVTVPAHGAMLLRIGAADPIAPALVGPLWERGDADAAFGYTVLTSGTRPITLTATGLPTGLTLSGNLISGTAAAGTYDVALTATNAGGITTGTLRLEIGEQGAIEQLSASELIAPPGQPVTLTWVTTGTSVALDGAAVDPSGTLDVTPTETTTYTLTADGDSHTITVEVPTAEVQVGLTSPGRLRPTNDPAEWQGWETASEDWSADRAPLSVGGVGSMVGMATHAAARLEYPLGGHYGWFSAQVGVDDEVATTDASVEFVVSGDGVELWRSGVLGAGDAPVDVWVDVAGVESLELAVEDAGDGIDDDHADWLDPVVLIAAEVDDEDSGVGDTDAPVDTGMEVETGKPEGDGGCGCGGGAVSPWWGLALLLVRRRGSRGPNPLPPRPPAVH